MVKRTETPWIADDGTTHATRREAKAHDEDMKTKQSWAALQEWFASALSGSISSSVDEAAREIIQKIQADPTEFRGRVDLVIPPAKRDRKPKGEPAAKRGARAAAE